MLDIWEEKGYMIEELRAQNKTDIADIINGLVQIYAAAYGMSAYAINGGDCANFADELIDLYGSGEVLWHDDMDDCTQYEADYWSHCFVRIGNKYYDSECPEGVIHWKNLPCFVRSLLFQHIDVMRITTSCTAISLSRD